MINIFLGSDHAGFEVKERLKSFLNSKPENKVTDLGCPDLERVDYPDFANLVCSSLLKSDDKKAIGVLVCGSGQGMAMRANKYKEIRAALCWNEESAQLARKHNNANVICLGARMLEFEEIKKILKSFIESEFEGGRHQKRTEKIGYNTII